jgi:DNA-binding response OmpR family regulator
MTVSKTSARILIAEDEFAMRNVLSDLLISQGHRVILASNGEEALAKAASDKPDLILLDIMMPKLDGFSACARLRKTGTRTPILMLTARGQIGDRVSGLDAGADDYLAKPFSRAELLARVRALLRRSEVRDQTPDTLTLGETEIDFIQMKAKRGRRDLHLSPKEFAMLRMLAEAAGGVVTREEFLDAVWGYGSFPTTRTVDNHIAKLRSKIELDPAEPQFIKTVFGAGYQLVCES